MPIAHKGRKKLTSASASVSESPLSCAFAFTCHEPNQLSVGDHCIVRFGGCQSTQRAGRRVGMLTTDGKYTHINATARIPFGSITTSPRANFCCVVEFTVRSDSAESDSLSRSRSSTPAYGYNKRQSTQRILLHPMSHRKLSDNIIMSVAYLCAWNCAQIDHRISQHCEQ